MSRTEDRIQRLSLAKLRLYLGFLFVSSIRLNILERRLNMSTQFLFLSYTNFLSVECAYYDVIEREFTKSARIGYAWEEVIFSLKFLASHKNKQ